MQSHMRLGVFSKNPRIHADAKELITFLDKFRLTLWRLAAFGDF